MNRPKRQTSDESTAVGQVIRTGVLCVLGFLMVLPRIAAYGAEMPTGVTIDVKGGTADDPVGAGFDQIKSGAVLCLKLTAGGGTITKSEKIASESSPALWDKLAGETTWVVVGVRPYSQFYAVFKARVVPVAPSGKGKAGTGKWHFGSVSDVDIDADTDNDSKVTPRVPSGSASEDEDEYVTGDSSASPSGLIMWVEDGTGESPWCKVALSVNAKTKGNLTLNWDDKLEMKVDGGDLIGSPYSVPPTPIAMNGTPDQTQFLVRPKAATTQPANDLEITAKFVDTTGHESKHGEAVDKIQVSVVNESYLTLAVNSTAQTDDDYAPVEDTGARTPVTLSLMPGEEPPGDNTAPYTVTISEVDSVGDSVSPSKLRFWIGGDCSKNDPLEGGLELDWEESGDIKQQHTFYVSGLEVGVKYIQAKVTSDNETNPPALVRPVLRIFKLGVYLDDSYTTPLTDYPEETGEDPKPRSPKYLFCDEYKPPHRNILRLKIEVPGRDSFEREVIEPGAGVNSNEGEGVTTTLVETGWSTDVFTGRVYLTEDESASSPSSKIRIYHEPVLSFTFMPDGAHKLGAIGYMVDRGEVGVWWQGKYPDYSEGWAEIVRAWESMRGLMDETMKEVDHGDVVPPLPFMCNAAKGDLQCKRAHFDHPTNDDWWDSVDIAAYTGHGFTDNGTDFYIALFVDKVGGVKQPVQKVLPQDIGDLGNKDLEWAVFNTCRFMQNSDTELKKMFQGLHLALGYYSRMDVDPRAGTHFSYCLQHDQKTLWQAWQMQAQEYQEPGQKAQCYGVDDAITNDKVSADQGMPILLSRDPGSGATYQREQYIVGPP